MPWGGLTGSYGTFIFNFLRTLILISGVDIRDYPECQHWSHLVNLGGFSHTPDEPYSRFLPIRPIFLRKGNLICLQSVYPPVKQSPVLLTLFCLASLCFLCLRGTRSYWCPLIIISSWLNCSAHCWYLGGLHMIVPDCALCHYWGGRLSRFSIYLPYTCSFACLSNPRDQCFILSWMFTLFLENEGLILRGGKGRIMLQSFSCCKFKRKEITPSNSVKFLAWVLGAVRTSSPLVAPSNRKLVAVHLLAVEGSRLYQCMCTKAGAGGGDADSSK